MDFNIYSQILQISRSLLALYSIKLIVALLIFFIGRWCCKKLTKIVVRLLDGRNVDITLVKFIEGGIYYILLITVIIVAANQLGVKLAAFLTLLGAASLAIGLALKDYLANFSSGMMLILFRPFRVGDVVTVGGETGTVQQISIFNTTLHTVDNQRKIIPNDAISHSTITNMTANPTRRVMLGISIGYDDDILKARETLEEIIATDKRILTDPAPAIVVSELAESSVNLSVRSWVATADYWDVRFSLIEKIKLTFDKKNISFPYPQRDVHLHQSKD